MQLVQPISLLAALGRAELRILAGYLEGLSAEHTVALSPSFAKCPPVRESPPAPEELVVNLVATRHTANADAAFVSLSYKLELLGKGPRSPASGSTDRSFLRSAVHSLLSLLIRMA